MKYSIENRSLYHRYLWDFGGLNAAYDPSKDAPNRVVHMENMWRDYTQEGGSALETFPGMRLFTSLGNTVFGMWPWQWGEETYLVVHSGTSVYVIEESALENGSIVPPTPVASGVAQTKSMGFCWEGKFYFLDGNGYYMLSKTASGFLWESAKDRYVPTTHINGVPHEQRNLLCHRAKETYLIGTPYEYAHESPGIRYRILDAEKHTCEISGCDLDLIPDTLSIPGFKEIGGTVYRVVSIAWKAFFNCMNVTKVYIGEGLTGLGPSAFYNLIHLKTVSLPQSLKMIDRYAFHNCPIETLYMGGGVTHIGEGAFNKDPITTLKIYGKETAGQDTTVQDGNEGFLGATPVYMTGSPPCYFRFAFHNPVQSSPTVTQNGVAVSTSTRQEVYYRLDNDDIHQANVIVYTENGDFLTGKTLEMEIPLHHALFSKHMTPPAYQKYLTPGEDISTAVTGCTVFAFYDGRIFFSGNPNMPDIVFYASRNGEGQIDPSYVGIYQFFENGADAPVRALLPTASYLAVLSKDRYGDAAIRYRKGEDSHEDLIPRIYPAIDGVAGRGCAGFCLNFLDDPVFLSQEGVEAIEKPTLNLERTVSHRSNAIDPYLHTHHPEDAMGCVWQGYLVLLFPDGEGFLGDSRRMGKIGGHLQYEWYRLTGMGCHGDDIPVYCYADVLPPLPLTALYNGSYYPLELHPQKGGQLPGGATIDTYPHIYAAMGSMVRDGIGEVRYMVEADETGKKHAYYLSKTGERTGGTFQGATALCTMGDRLIVGCRGGQVCIVNTDRRGAVPPQLADTADPLDFHQKWQNQIHPLWYSMAGHRIVSGLVTAQDTCGVPHYMKKTERKTTIAEMKLPGTSAFSFQVACDRGCYQEVTAPLGFHTGELDFADVDLGMFTFTEGMPVNVPLREKTKRWVRKQYRIYSDSFASPFGIYRISYSYRIEGKVKIR